MDIDWNLPQGVCCFQGSLWHVRGHGLRVWSLAIQSIKSENNQNIITL